MIVVTGAAGFIGSCLIQYLNEDGMTNLVLVDDFARADKNRNFKGKKYKESIHRVTFINWFQQNARKVDAVYHLGARTDTTEQSWAIFEHLNVQYSQQIWQICAQNRIPLVYASSAATYGLGEFGYDDNHQPLKDLQPLNPYGVSKHQFDLWAQQQTEQPPYWYGLKFFNVYGPNEYHKGRMASVIFHAHKQILTTSEMKLFRSHRDDIKDGYQSRDFIYVKDVVKVCHWLLENTPANGLYNVGTGTAKPFVDLVTHTFEAMGKTPNISFIDTPEDIRDTYQYFTEARISKLRNAGYNAPFVSLGEGVKDYVSGYLKEEKYY